jgi:cyanophycinase
MSVKKDADDAEDADDAKAGGPGRLFALGGLAERARERELLRIFLAAAVPPGAPGAHIVVLVLSSEPVDLRGVSGAAERWGDIFYDLGASSVEVIRGAHPDAAAADRSQLDRLEDATGLFFAGTTGAGLWLPLPDDRALLETVRRRHRAGVVVGGTGTGAALLPALSLAPASGSGGTGASGRRRALRLAPGLGLVSGLLLDSIPRQRDRLNRLLLALALDPTTLAVGIDDDTAVVIDPAASTLEVLGLSAALVVDAAEAIRPASVGNTIDVFPMLGLRVDVLTAGCRYDLRTRRSLPGAVHGAHGPWAPPGSPAKTSPGP